MSYILFDTISLPYTRTIFQISSKQTNMISDHRDRRLTDSIFKGNASTKKQRVILDCNNGQICPCNVYPFLWGYKRLIFRTICRKKSRWAHVFTYLVSKALWHYWTMKYFLNHICLMGIYCFLMTGKTYEYGEQSV